MECHTKPARFAALRLGEGSGGEKACKGGDSQQVKEKGQVRAMEGEGHAGEAWKKAQNTRHLPPKTVKTLDRNV